VTEREREKERLRGNGRQHVTIREIHRRDVDSDVLARSFASEYIFADDEYGRRVYARVYKLRDQTLDANKLECSWPLARV